MHVELVNGHFIANRELTDVVICVHPLPSVPICVTEHASHLLCRRHPDNVGGNFNYRLQLNPPCGFSVNSFETQMAPMTTDSHRSLRMS